MNAIDLIIQKRNGGALSREEISFLVKGYTDGSIPDYQMAAFMMASFLQGLSESEMVSLTETMLHSGEVLDLSEIPGIKVDKHSTGGVGDKISIVLAPLVAACGVKVPMISGRGLGHTGGTLDKLESIPGFQTTVSTAVYRKQLAEIGVVMIGQTKDITPADKKMYALRDATGTVEYIPFIAASILSKKLAEGADALVLDVKCGSGAMMQSEQDARVLAETMTRLAESFGTPTTTFLTDMNNPLGHATGNWPEIVECIDCLHGNGPDDVMEVTIALAVEMLLAGKVASSQEEAKELCNSAISSGRAFEKFVEMVEVQGGSAQAIRDPASRNENRVEVVVHASQSGVIKWIDSRDIGRASVVLGAGRATKEDSVDPLAGIILTVKPGDTVQIGESIALIQASTNAHIERTIPVMMAAFKFDEETPKEGSRLLSKYQNGRWVNP